MNIGLTYDLITDYLAAGYSKEQAAEFDKPETIDAIADALAGFGHTVDRIGHVKALAARLVAGDRWDLVFNIAEGLEGVGREAQVPALLEAYGVPATFGDSVCLALCLHKGYCKNIVADNGVPTPKFVVVADSGYDFGTVDLAYPLFVKPVAEGTGKGVTSKARVENAADLEAICRDLLKTFRQPILVEEYLSGREFTVGIVGTGRAARVLGVMEVEFLDTADPGAYTYENKDQYLDRVRYHLVADSEALRAGEVALAAYRILGCRDAGRIDIRSDAMAQPSFIEANPLAGLNPAHSDLPILCRLGGYGYEQLIGDIIVSARERL